MTELERNFGRKMVIFPGDRVPENEPNLELLANRCITIVAVFLSADLLDEYVVERGQSSPCFNIGIYSLQAGTLGPGGSKKVQVPEFLIYECPMLKHAVVALSGALASCKTSH